MLLTALRFVDRLLPIEREYFLWINQQRSDFLDTFMFVYSDKLTWLPLFIIFVAVLLYKTNWKQALLFALCGVAIGLLCDFVSAEFIKPYFARLRPTHHPDFIDFVDIVNHKRGGQFGFISNHAANGFGITVFTSLLFRYRYYTITAYAWVLVTCYSRIYLGVHFITDVIGGFIWGTLAGLSVYFIYSYARIKVFKMSPQEASQSLLSIKKIHILMLTILLTVVYIIVRALFFPIEE